MLGKLKSMLGLEDPVNYYELIQNGAKIVDVRTPSEYRMGHIKGSINIPLQELNRKHKKLNKNQTIITCCASGVRSASAKNILESNGFKEVYNGKGWARLQSKIG
ncbi:rhodanese-like domain-containing protein [Parvicella tangerina]|uniref:Thiosulfate sulfurtransferase GlpE n=1 Tax=Parvicella tangerina TaxID=2829795 RepID=A0A916N8Q2_9FLAO|nr:rhodanese-like domain-containing protein [Parvicella tangerina]CAG5077432.1 Thiosulfate sulfurtransferase GlpE [Parvicella tangerina]